MVVEGGWRRGWFHEGLRRFAVSRRGVKEERKDVSMDENDDDGRGLW